MHRLILILLPIIQHSCQYFEKQKTQDSVILEEYLKTINWNDVDTYPTFPNCDSIIAKSQNKICFQNTITTSVQNFLKNKKETVFFTVTDTLMLKLSINKQAKISIESLDIKPETKIKIPEIDSLLKQSILQLPKLLYPAIKRGQFVTTAFTLPIIVIAEKPNNK